MESQRNMLVAIVLSALILFGWSALAPRLFPTANPPVAKVEAGKVKPLPTPDAAPTPSAQPPAAPREAAQVIAGSARIPFANGRVQGSINLTGARIDDLVLPTYRETIDGRSPPVRLLAPAGARGAYYAQFGWSGDNVQLPGPQTVWTADRARLAPGEPVTLSWTSPQNLRFTLTLALDDKYLFTVAQRVANGSGASVKLRPFALVARDGKSPDPDSWTAHVGPMWVINDRANYDVSFANLDGQEPGFWARVFGTSAVAGTNVQNSNGGWLGFTDKYWLTALAPQGQGPLLARFAPDGRGGYQADYAAAPVAIAPGTEALTTTRLFAGAKEVSVLDGYEASAGIPLFGKAIDWGWYEVIEKPIFRYLSWLFHLTGNFGVAIILLTATVRLLMFPIAQRQFASMAAMRGVQPKMKALQERYKDDKPRLQQEIMALYKAEKVNPLAGCLPILIQIPIFFALYKVLILSTEMRHQPFVAWIRDLSAPDPLTPVNLFGLLDFTPPHFLAIGVLPILLGVTQYLQFRLNPQPMDEVQAQIFKLMPWVFMFIMAIYPAGLIVYWCTTNLLTIAQQWWLYRRHPALAPATT